MKPLPTSTPARVDFDALVGAYEASIERVLRSFRPENAPEWLDLWVHDEDPHRSLLSMIEAAADAGLTVVEVAIQDTSIFDLDRVKALVARVGNLSQQELPGGGLLLVVSLRGGKPAPSAAAPGPARRVVTRPQAAASRPAAPVLVREGDEAYREAVEAILGDLRHEGSAPQGEGALVQSECEGRTLSLRIDPVGHTVLAASYQGGTSPFERAALETLCRILEGRPLREGSDHGALRVLYALRSGDAPRAVPGVVCPANANPGLDVVQALLRDACAQHWAAQETSPNGLNMFDPGPSEAWRRTPSAERIARVQAALETLCEQLQLPPGTCLSAAPTGSLAVAFSEPVSSRQGDRVLRLERGLKRLVEPGVFLHLEAMPDQSKIRRL